MESKLSANIDIEGPFRVLNPYPDRILIAKTNDDLEEVMGIMGDYHSATEISLRKKRIGKKNLEFSVFSIREKTVYVILLGSPSSGPSKIKNLFDLIAITRNPSIIYVHYKAIPLFKISSLQNFPSILLRDQKALISYFSSELLGNDEKEILFNLAQKQAYVMEEILPREEFAKKKANSSGNKRGDRKDSFQNKPNSPIAIKNNFVEAVRKNLNDSSEKGWKKEEIKRGPRAGRNVISDVKKEVEQPDEGWVLPEEDDNIFIPIPKPLLLPREEFAKKKANSSGNGKSKN